MKLEGPQLSLKTFRAYPHNWLSIGAKETDRALALTMKGKELWSPSEVEPHHWQFLEPNETLIDLPDALYDSIYLNEVLETYTLENQKSLLKELARMVKNGGVIVSLSKALTDAEEVFEVVKMTNATIDNFYNYRLNNRDIVRLKPNQAAFFNTLSVAPTRKRLVLMMKDLGINDACLEHLWQASDRFAINRFYVGMKWWVNRDG